MAEELPGKTEGPPHSEEGASRRRSLTPEQRRLLNRPQSAPVEHRSEASSVEKSPRRTRRASARLSEADGKKVSRSIEFQGAILIIAVIIGLGLAFYFGTKIGYLKYLLTSRDQPSLPESGEKQFQGVAVADLVEQALVAEREGRWQDAVERFMAAKRKDLQYRGILFRVGKLLYDHRDFEQADKAFEQALAFGENPDAANFFRGLIAVRTKNLPAAERFFAAAVTAAPFVSDYHYYRGETLRLDLKPKPAIPCYEQAVLLARDEQSAAVCRFKMRMARIEAAESEAVNLELANRQKSASPLSVDWLMTAAALKSREGHIDEARPFIEQARAANSPGLFASCVNDLYFHDVAQKYPELADVLHLDLDLQIPFPE
jgi:tetratricopeptide (TPR) repeat protein